MLPLTSLQSCLAFKNIPMYNDIFVVPNTGTEILTPPNSSQHPMQHAMKHQLLHLSIYID